MSEVFCAKPVKILRIFVGSHLPPADKKKTDTQSGVRFFLAAELGIEPRQRDSETLVLPLHNSAKLRSLLQAGLIIPHFSHLSRDFYKKTKEICTKVRSGKEMNIFLDFQANLRFNENNKSEMGESLCATMWIPVLAVTKTMV